MSQRPDTFSPISNGWTVSSLNPETVPVDLRQRISQGIPAQVPGEVTMDMVRENLIPDPFDANNESKQQWIGDVDWQYSCSFEWHSDGNERHDLVAYGLDTVAGIRLNEQLIGYAQNYHRTYRWDIRGALREGMNTLTVTFTSSVREADRREQALGYYPHTEHHPFNQLRKPSYQFGWDWGIDIANAGIWQEIGIDSWSGVRIDSVRPLVDVASDGSGILTVHTEVERAGSGPMMASAQSHEGLMPVRLNVHVSGNGVDIHSEGEIQYGHRTGIVNVSVPDAQLWWPVGYGSQPLYEVSVTVQNDDGSGQWRGRVGFRTVHVDTRADDVGRPFQIYVNDVPVHARGYNWIPVDAFMSQATPDLYERRFKDLVESNSNMVRAWGGSIYESDEFYELADRLGIMVWQDFAFACAAYPEDSDTRSEAEAESREHIIRLSQHPSLIVWNGSNENYVAYAEWGGFKQALRDDDLAANQFGYGEKGWGNYYYSELIPSLLSELDPTRIYLPSSPMSFTNYVDANKDIDGTMHIWDIWNRVDYRHYADYKPRFADEFGYQAPPAWSTLTRVVHDDLDPNSEQMLAHQKASGGNIKLARGMRSHLTPGNINDVSFDENNNRDWLIPSDQWKSTEDWHWACQLQQAHAIRFGVEYMRSIEPINAGSLIWQLNDDWPVISWSAVDYDGHRKPLWYASRNFFASQFATIQPRVSEQRLRDNSWEGTPVSCDHLVLALSNDVRESWSGSWEVERMTLAGVKLAQQHIDVSMNPISHVEFALNDDISHFGDQTNEIIVATPSSSFARVIFNGADVLEQQLESEPLKTSVETIASGYALHITASSFARDVFCMADKVDTHASVNDGMVTLLPGESVTWMISSDMDTDPENFVSNSVLRCANDLKPFTISSTS